MAWSTYAGTTTGIALILSGGVENVLSGGLLSGAKQSGTSVQGTLNISAGGTAAFLGVASGGLANVFGTITNNETVSGGGVENVFSGGVVTGTSSTGNIDLGTLNGSSGGSAAFIVISSGGVTTIASSGTAHDVTISSGGLLNVLGAVTSDTIVLSGGVEMISSGGVDSGSVARGTIVSGGTVDVLSGGRFDFGTVSSGGVLNVFGTTNSTNEISSGGVENVWSGGLVGGALDSGTVLAGGTLNVFSGGTAAFVEISIGLGSGSLSPSTLDSIQRQVTDGSIFISSPPPFSVTWLGGTLNVSQGGLAHDIDVGASGFLNVLGSTTSNVRVFSGGTVNVSSGGVLYSISQSIGVFDGEAVNVAPGDVPGELNFGIIVNPIVPSAVLSGGVLNVSAGGWANGVVISSGSIENDAGSTTFTTVLSGGNLFVSSGGAGGIIMVSSGGSATVLSGGSLNGMPGPTVVVSGGVLTVSAGGTTTATDFEWGGLEVVLGVASTTVLGIGGQAIVSSGGIASSMINYSGAFDILSGGAAISASLANGFYTRGIIAAGGTATGTTNGGNVTVLGADVSATIFGLEFVSSGGTLSNATVSSGGMVELFAGAAISGGLTLKPGATIEFGSGSGYVASGFVVSSGITAVVLSGGAALSNTISGLEVLYGGVASATTISGGTMELALGGSANGAITFAGPGGTLQIDGISMPANTISGFMPATPSTSPAVPFNLGGSADLLLGNVLQITEAGQQYDLNLDPSQDFAGKFFHLNAIASGGILVTEDITPCYCAGSLILTDRGEVEVERLAIGDNVVTANGAARPIRWIGRRSYAGRFARGSHVLPICIKAGALDVDQPRRDLWVSPQHAMFLEGALIEAIDLINGVSIVQADRVERVDYFHIELDTHDIIIAEGALSESFVDDDSRGIFQNAHEFAALYPNTPAVRPARYCAPRVAFGTRVEAARRQIAQRAGIPYTPSSNAKRPRALVVDSWVPQLGHDGGANAILDHIGALQAAGFEVSFLALRGDCSDASALSSLGVSPCRCRGAAGSAISPVPTPANSTSSICTASKPRRVA